jgi:hypothetical protein
MAQDFDEFPLYDPLVKRGTDKMSNVWTDFIATFYMNLIGYLTSGGILLPQVTTAQRDQLMSPQNGQIIYNTTLNTAQYFKNGVWTSI